MQARLPGPATVVLSVPAAAQLSHKLRPAVKSYLRSAQGDEHAADDD